MKKLNLLILPLILFGCSNSDNANFDELSVADQTEAWIDSLVVVEGDTREQTDARYVPRPENAEYDPEVMKVIVEHFDDPRDMWKRLAVARARDPDDSTTWQFSDFHSIGIFMRRIVERWLSESKGRLVRVRGKMEYARNHNAFVHFIKDCKYDLKIMRAKYKEDLAKEKEEH